MPYHAYVYILANGFKKLYIGMTNNLERRILDHKQQRDPQSHTAKYNITDLVYFERFTNIPAAINREKVLKGWLRRRKLELIIATNPTWQDFSAEWGQKIQMFSDQEPSKFSTKEGFKDQSASLDEEER